VRTRRRRGDEVVRGKYSRQERGRYGVAEVRRGAQRLVKKGVSVGGMPVC